MRVGKATHRVATAVAPALRKRESAALERGEHVSLRPIKQIIQPKPTIEGAGVKLQRAFGFGKTKDFDPFLLLDDFRAISACPLG